EIHIALLAAGLVHRPAQRERHELEMRLQPREILARQRGEQVVARGCQACGFVVSAHLLILRSRVRYRTLALFHAMSADAQRAPARRCRSTTPRTARIVQ